MSGVKQHFNAVPHILTDVIKVSAGWYNQQSVTVLSKILLLSQHVIGLFSLFSLSKHSTPVFTYIYCLFYR